MCSIDEYNVLCLLINIVLWISAFIVYSIKSGYFGVGNAILLFYSFLSIFSFHLFYSSYSWMFNSLQLFPFIYLFIMILLASYPILVIKERYLKKITHPSPLLFNTVCLFIIIFSFFKLPSMISSIQENMLAIIIEETAGAQAYSISTGEYVSKTSSEGDLLSVLSGMCCSVSLAFLGYYITKRKKNRIILIGLIVSSLMQPLYGISHGSRSSIASFVLNFIFVMLFIRGTVSKNIKLKIYKFFISVTVILLIPFFAVTVSRRSGDIEMSALSIERYFAEGPLRFNNYGLDAGGIRYGDNTIVIFKKLVGLDPAMYYQGRLMKYRSMKIDESVFYTFVGDFTLDFGAFGAIILFCFSAVVFRKFIYVKNGQMEFWQYLLAYILIVSCLGYYQFPFGRETGNAQLIMFLFLIILFWCDGLIRKKSFKI